MFFMILFSAYRYERPLDIDHPQNRSIRDQVCREIALVEQHPVYKENTELKSSISKVKGTLSQRDIRSVARQMDFLMVVLKDNYSHHFPAITRNASRWETRSVPAVYGLIKICDGCVKRDSCYYGDDARSWCSRQYRKYSSDPNIKSGSVSTSYDHCETSVGGFFWSCVNWNYGSSNKGMRVYFTHKDGCNTCTNYHTVRGVTKEATTEQVSVNYTETVKSAETKVCKTGALKHSLESCARRLNEKAEEAAKTSEMKIRRNFQWLLRQHRHSDISTHKVSLEVVSHEQ